MTGAPHSSVKRYRELARTPTKNGHERELLLDGVHLLLEARASGLAVESAAFQHDALSDPSIRTLAEQLAADGADVLIVSRKVMESMSPVKTPTGVVGIARRSTQTLKGLTGGSPSVLPLIVVAHDVQDPGNVGGIMRTAEAAGATGFIASTATADPLGWKALRGSMGSALRLPIARAEIDRDASRPCDLLMWRPSHSRPAADGRFSAPIFASPPRSFSAARGPASPRRLEPNGRAHFDSDARAGRIAERWRRGSARAL